MNKIKAFFRHSRTIVLARLYSLMGLVVTAHDFILPYVIGQDWSPLTEKVPPHLWPFIIIFTGLLFEWMRTLTKESLKDKNNNGIPDDEEEFDPDADLSHEEAIKKLHAGVDEEQDNEDDIVSKLMNETYDHSEKEEKK